MDELEEIRRKKLLELMKKLEEKKKPKVVHVRSVDQVIKESYSRLVVVDFYANWCMPCRYIGPLLEKLAEEHGFLLAKIDIDAYGEEAARWGVEAVPTVIFLRNGKEVFRFTGARDASFIKAAIRKFGR